MRRAGLRDGVWTVPNVIGVLRILGTGPLLWAAHQGHRHLFLVILVLILLSDWVDGKLAHVLDQRTELGARLDSAADAVMYAAVAVAFWWMEGEAVRERIGWFLAVLATWLLSAGVAAVRFGRLPSYHTRAAKVSWLVAGATALGWLLAGYTAPVPWALGLVILTNLEAALMGFVLPEWRADVPGLLQALRIRGGSSEDAADGGPGG